MDMRFAIELAKSDARLGANAPRPGIDVDPFHAREVDHETAVANGSSAIRLTEPFNTSLALPKT